MRYFFDISEDGRTVTDTEGTELLDVPAAAIEAAQAMGEMARDQIPTTTAKTISMSVRDDKGIRLSLEMKFTLVKH